jgi:putative ABC transport system permease protein
VSRFDPLVRSAEDEEIRHHLSECVDTLVEQGWEPEAARAEAERRFGAVPEVRRELSALALWTRLATALEFVAADIRYAVRGLWLNRTFTLAVVATLALGIGAVSSIFSVADAALLRPLAFAEADRWVQLWGVREDGNRGAPGLRLDRFARWREATAGIFDGWVASVPTSVVRTDAGRAEQLDALAITPGAEQLLGIPMLVGRGFTSDDARPGAAAVAVMRRGYWERLGADPGVVGSTIGTSAGPITIVGVLDTDLKVPLGMNPQDLWITLRDDFTALDQQVRASQWIWARRAEGVSQAAAQDRVDALTPGLDAEEATAYNWRLYLEPLGTERFNEEIRQALGLLVAMVGAIYLIGLLNGVNLLLVRRAARGRELALRASLGASWTRILRQLLTEGLVLGCLGGAAAAMVARVVIRAMARAAPQDFSFSSPFTFAMEARTLWFIVATALFAGALLGLIPAVGLRRSSVAPGMGTSRATEGRGTRRAQNALVTAQVALSTVLLAGAVLLGSSLARLVRVDLGFDHERLAYGIMGLTPPRYPDGHARAELVRRLEQGLEALPEVSGATVIRGGRFVFGALETEGESVRPGQPEMVPYDAVGIDYFEVTGTRVVAGRAFEPADAGSLNAIVDRDLAGFLWPGRDPIGRRFRPEPTYPWYTVVGVAEELKLAGRDDRTRPYQYVVVGSADSIPTQIQLVVRTEGSPARLLPLMERTLWSLDREQTYFAGQLVTASEALAIYEDQPRFLTGLIGALAGVAVALAAVGLYGVLAYAVTRRSREIGIRIAIGARPARIRRSVLGEGMAVATLGAALGLAAAFVTARALDPFLYAVEPRDPRLFALTAGLLLAVAAVACLLPAQRATRVDPMQVLRAD